MSNLNLPLIQSYKPASFLERGVAVPFTTPQLAGARVRPAERTGTEFVVPNPSGGRGVYVLHWGGVRQLCRPTVHDTLLHQRIGRLPSMDPRGVRMAVRALASEGMAGRAAATAAAASADADHRERTLLHFLLLILLMEQVDPIGLRPSAETERTPELDLRARWILQRFAASIGRGAEEVGVGLESLSGEFVATGLETGMPPSRLARLNARLRQSAETLEAWAKRHPDDGYSNLAASLGRSARVTSTCAGATLRAAHATTHDMRGLLQAWIGSPGEVVRQIGRPEWVLDGWERFCLLWENASHISDQRAVLHEMAQLVPLLPREAADWHGEEPAALEALEPSLRATRLNEAWRAGAASHGLVARNENLQSLIE